MSSETDSVNKLVEGFKNLSMVVKFAFFSVVLLVLVTITGIQATWNNQNASTPEYTYWQDTYKHIAVQLATTDQVRDATRNLAEEVNQVTVLQFPVIEQDGTTQQRVDRCESCHVGLLNPQMTAENIIKVMDGKTIPTEGVAAYLDSHPKTLELVKTLGAHPGLDIEGAVQRDLGVIHDANFTYGVTVDHTPAGDDSDAADYAVQKLSMSKHPFPTYGCTTCHYGSGRELQQNLAHGLPEHWLQPLLAKKYMDAACAQCHIQYDPKTFQINYLQPITATVNGKQLTIPLMSTIARGEQLFKDKACYGCHKIEGFAKGNVGPELTYEGRLAVPSTIEHQIWDPRYKVNTCVMPYFFSYRLYDSDETQFHPETADKSFADLFAVAKSGHLGDNNKYVIDPRALRVTPATIDNQDTVDSLAKHGYVPDAAAQADIDALVTFVSAQTGQTYAGGQADRIATISAYNAAAPGDVPTTVAEGKQLFDTSGCFACHTIGDPSFKGNPMDDPHAQGGVAGPPLTWEGSRHSTQWLIEHYKNPQEFVPGSIMPIFPFSDTQRQALALYDQSLMPNNPGARTVTADQDMPSALLAQQGAVTPDIRYLQR